MCYYFSPQNIECMCLSASVFEKRASIVWLFWYSCVCIYTSHLWLRHSLLLEDCKCLENCGTAFNLPALWNGLIELWPFCTKCYSHPGIIFFFIERPERRHREVWLAGHQVNSVWWNSHVCALSLSHTHTHTCLLQTAWSWDFTKRMISRWMPDRNRTQ